MMISCFSAMSLLTLFFVKESFEKDMSELHTKLLVEEKNEEEIELSRI